MQYPRAMRLALVAIGVLLSVELNAQVIESRQGIITRAQVWQPTDTPSLNLRRGPSAPAGFAPGQLVTCDYLDKEMSGRSMKFACLIAPDDEVKVKFGGRNGEVQGEVAATRLLWALGFGADRMHPVRVICRGCPEAYGEATGRPGERLIDPAVIERKLPGREMFEGDAPGWSWLELDLIDENAGGATRAQRDALRLLAVFLQHTDTKPEQQRLVCLDNPKGDALAPCERPFMMLNDVGLTFGRANLMNANPTGSVNLREWSETPVWKGTTGCVGNLPRSFTGTLKDPVISEEGRRLLGGLLLQLTDAQLQDLFDVSRVQLRPRSPDRRPSAAASVEQWVDAFKQKRDEVVNRRCDSTWSASAPALFSTGPILWLQSWSSPPLTALMNGISLLGYTGLYMALAVVLALGYRARAGAALLVVLALTAALNDATQAVVTLPRPDAVDSAVQTLGVYQPLVDGADAYGFPSGHVAAATVFCLGLALLFGWRRALLALMLWVPLMGLSRLYLGRQFPADLLGGVAVAVITAAIAILGLTLNQLENRARQWRIVARTLVVAIGVAAIALLLGFPSMGQAGRLLGLTVGLLVVVWMDAGDETDARVRVGRIGLAALLFPIAWWGTWLGLGVIDADDTRAATLTANAVAGALLLAGPIWMERVARAKLIHTIAIQ